MKKTTSIHGDTETVYASNGAIEIRNPEKKDKQWISAGNPIEAEQ